MRAFYLLFFCVVSLALAPAKAMVCNSGPFIIFFDSNSNKLNLEAKHRLDYAIETFASACFTNSKMLLAGHADRAGAASYNQKLSKRRIEDFGESKPLVRTRDGVPEKDNRRVEVFLGPPPSEAAVP